MLMNELGRPQPLEQAQRDTSRSSALGGKGEDGGGDVRLVGAGRDRGQHAGCDRRPSRRTAHSLDGRPARRVSRPPKRMHPSSCRTEVTAEGSRRRCVVHTDYVAPAGACSDVHHSRSTRDHKRESFRTSVEDRDASSLYSHWSIRVVVGHRSARRDEERQGMEVLLAGDSDER
jgi:hypothetical protein